MRFCLFALVLSSFTEVAVADPLRVAIVAPFSANVTHVVLTNTGDKQLTLFSDAYSWGYYALSFELVDSGAETFLVKKKPRGWDKNVPATHILAPGESWAMDVDFDPTIWRLPATRLPGRSQRIQNIRAIYTVTPDAESRRLSAWTGRVQSELVRLAADLW